MAVDKLVDSAQLDADLTSVADAIRTKTGGTADLQFPADFVSEIGSISGGGSGLQWELIGSVELELSEYTNTSTGEETDTGINVKTTDYAYFMSIITCDSAITTSTEWGMTISFGGRYTSDGSYRSITNGGQKGASTLSKSAMVSNSVMWNSYGVSILNSSSTIIMSRKAHGTACPKVRGGTYTVAVYGLASL